MVLFILLIIFIFLLLFILTAGIIKDLRNPPPKLPRFNSAQEQADTVRRYLDASKAARKYPRI